MNGIHQIEITSRCNLRCTYCVHPKMQRPKIDMDLGTYIKSLQWVKYFVDKGTQGPELNLAGIGESTMHPDFAEYVRLAREALGDKRNLILATNGILVTEELAEVLREYNVFTWVSLHRPEKAGPAANILKRAGVLKGYSADPSVASVDWAGQVDWEVTAPRSECTWLKGNVGFVLADGRVSRCCFDGEGVGVLGTVNDQLSKLNVTPYELCAKCHLDVPVEAIVSFPGVINL